MEISLVNIFSFQVMLMFSFQRVLNAQETYFMLQPNTNTCTEGQECIFVCAAKNFDRQKQVLKWQRDQIQISLLDMDTKFVESIQHNSGRITQSSLVINWLDREDARYRYSCIIVSLETGDILMNSDDGTLKVKEVPPPHFPLCSSGQTYSVGDKAKFTCTSEKTQNSVVSLNWFRDRVRILNSNKIKDFKRNGKIISELTIRVTAAHKGSIYVCHQVLDVDVQVNKTCRIGPLDITFEPKITITGPSVIPLYSDALFVCSSIANPPTTINEWIEPLDLPPSSYVLENYRQVLRIVGATLSMNGTQLKCIGINSLGRVEKTIALIVYLDDSNTLKPASQRPTIIGIPNEPHDISKILSVAGMCLLLTAVLIGLLLCYLQFCKFGLFPMHAHGEHIAQPEVYFEPKDNIRCTMSPYDDNGMYQKRSVAIQVTPGLDTDSVYAEVEDGKKT